MIDRLERLVNLVIALRETRRPLPADEIHRRVAGYDQGSHDAFRRTFERDKADLRAIGVPVETVTSPGGEDVEGYRIDPRAYDLPPVELASDELAAVAVALQATGLSASAPTGLRKLQVGAGSAPADEGPLGWSVDIEDPSRVVLSEAQLTRTRVRFSYRRADGTTSTRLVEPHGLVLRGGRWYLRARDDERGDVRTFRLDRIDGPVATRGRAGAFTLPDGPLDVEEVVPDRTEGVVTALVAADEEVAWLVARRAQGEVQPSADGRAAYQVTARADDLVRWALEMGPEIELLEPDHLRRAVARSLADVRRVHERRLHEGERG